MLEAQETYELMRNTTAYLGSSLKRMTQNIDITEIFTMYLL